MSCHACIHWNIRASEGINTAWKLSKKKVLGMLRDGGVGLMGWLNTPPFTVKNAVQKFR